MKTEKNLRTIKTRTLFRFAKSQAQGLTTTDPITITINTNTGHTSTIIITHLAGVSEGSRKG